MQFSVCEASCVPNADTDPDTGPCFVLSSQSVIFIIDIKFSIINIDIIKSNIGRIKLIYHFKLEKYFPTRQLNYSLKTSISSISCLHYFCQ